MRRTLTALALAAGLGLAGCDAEPDEVPETAEVEVEPMEAELEFDEELVLGPEDVGETLMATGWVSGTPLPGGFFLRTEDARLIFVETVEPEVSAGDQVRVIGPLVVTEVAVFEGWETDAFEDELEAEWDLERAYFIDAVTVTPLDELEEAMEAEAGTTEAGTDTM